MQSIARIVLSGLLAAAGAAPAYAQYPDRPIRVIVPVAAGSALDSATRAMTQGLTKRMGWNFVVENKTGANSVIGTMAAAAAPADGYTIYAGAMDAMEINPHVLDIKYDPIKSFDPIAPIGSVPVAMVARSDFPANTVADVVKMARESPGKLTYGSWGIGSFGHLAFVMLEQSAGISMLHVPYISGTASNLALQGKQIDLLLVAMYTAQAQQKAGKLKILGMTSGSRSKYYPEVPTLKELGYPDFAWEQWVGLFFPAGAPAEARELLAREMNAFAQSPEGMATFQRMGYESAGGTTEDLRQQVLSGKKRWERIVKDRNIRVQ